MEELEKKISKVAICNSCKGYVLACHVNYLSSKTEKEFTKLTNEGFSIFIESGNKTRNRELQFRSKKIPGVCEECEKNN